ncbi:hypothetical protein N8569_00650 [bacterium]|jgi:hypothetical protein|nr:hypothetical protein [bacterium]
MNLNTIALNNIIILNNLDLKKFHIDVKDRVFLEVLENKDDVDNFTNIVELKNLEYSIYFSFHQLLQMSIRELIEDYTRKDVLNMMENALNNIYRLYGKEVFSDENERVYNIMEEIDSIIFECKLKLKQNYCKFKMLDMFEYLLTGFKVYHNNSINFLSLYSISSDSDEDDVSEDDDEPKPYPFKDLEDNDEKIKIYKPKLTRTKSEEELLLTGDICPQTSSDDDSDDNDDDNDDVIENDNKRQKLE